MLETDRDLYLAFARALNLDFGWAARLIDGEMSAAPLLAETLAQVTDSEPRYWREDGRGPLRLMAVKIWGVKARRAGRLIRPATLDNIYGNVRRGKQKAVQADKEKNRRRIEE